jgi:hypothetical protein
MVLVRVETHPLFIFLSKYHVELNTIIHMGPIQIETPPLACVYEIPAGSRQVEISRPQYIDVVIELAYKMQIRGRHTTPRGNDNRAFGAVQELQDTPGL